jgi:hypothetical protein
LVSREGQGLLTTRSGQRSLPVIREQKFNQEYAADIDTFRLETSMPVPESNTTARLTSPCAVGDAIADGMVLAQRKENGNDCSSRSNLQRRDDRQEC